MCCAISSKVVAAGDDANILIVYERESSYTSLELRLIHAFEHDDEVTCCAISGNVIVAGDDSHKLIVRDLMSGQIQHTLFHGGPVNCCAISGDVFVAGDAGGPAKSSIRGGDSHLVVRSMLSFSLLDPLPGEIHYDGALTAVSRRPHLLHRQGAESNTGEIITLLHRLANAGEVDFPSARLEEVLATIEDSNNGPRKDTICARASTVCHRSRRRSKHPPAGLLLQKSNARLGSPRWTLRCKTETRRNPRCWLRRTLAQLRAEPGCRAIAHCLYR